MSTPNGYREFLCTKDDKTLVNLSVRQPDKKELEASDMEYSGTFNRSLLGGLPTQAKMLRNLRENEVISPADEAEMGQLFEDVRLLNTQLRDLKDKKFTGDDDATKVAKEANSVEQKKVMDARETKQTRLAVLNREIEAMLAHTADNKANEAQRNFLVACVVEFVDGPKKGSRVWASVDELLDNKDSALLNRVLYAYMMCQADLPDEWDRLTENQSSPAPQETSPAVVQAAQSAVPAVSIPEPAAAPDAAATTTTEQPVDALSTS